MNTTSSQSPSVPTIILQQLGGKRFILMTGARHISGDGNTLSFSLPSNFAKDGINLIKITLEPSDTYKVEVLKLGRAPSYKMTTVYETDDIYADSLQELFTRHTGLNTHL